MFLDKLDTGHGKHQPGAAMVELDHSTFRSTLNYIQQTHMGGHQPRFGSLHTYWVETGS